MVKISRDRVTGMIGITFGILIILASLGLPSSRVPNDPGPAVFPVLGAVIMILSGLALIVKKPDPKKPDKQFLAKEEWIRFAKMLGTLVLYFLLLWLIGFVPATAIVLFIMSILFLEGKKIIIWKQILISGVITAITFICFQVFLGFILPQGILVRMFF